jgi:hypothetical protein
MSEEEPDVEEEQTRLLNCNGLPKKQVQQVTYLVLDGLLLNFDIFSWKSYS